MGSRLRRIDFFALLLSLRQFPAQPLSTHEQPDPLLQQQLEVSIKDFKGDVGIYVRHLPSGRSDYAKPSRFLTF